MGVKKKYCSEYRTSFKSKYPCFTKVYEQNLGYRIERRSVEHFHHAEPFLWDTESSGTDSDQTNCAGVANPHSLPLHIYKHEKYNKAYRDHLEKLKQKFESSLKVTTPQNNVQDKAVMTTSHNLRQEQTQTNSAELAVRDKIERDGSHDRHRNGGDDQERMSSTSSLDREESSHSDQEDRRSRKPQNPEHEKTRPRIRSRSGAIFVPIPRPASEPLEHSPKKNDDDEDDKAPFLPYGYKYRSVNIGKKKTYNVRASADIYPSALRAQKRRKALITKQEELEKSTSHREKQKRALYGDFNERVRRDTGKWETEYRHHFAGYNKEVYERSLSARPASRQHDSDLLAATW